MPSRHIAALLVLLILSPPVWSQSELDRESAAAASSSDADPKEPATSEAGAGKAIPAKEAKPAASNNGAEIGPEAPLPDVEVTQEPAKEDEGGEPAEKKPVEAVEATEPPPPRPAKTKKKRSAKKSTSSSANAQPSQKPPSQAAVEPVADEFSPEVLINVNGVLVVPDDAFASVTTTTASEINAGHKQTLADTLAGKPGLTASTFAPGASRPIVRGLDNTRVRLQENGIGTHDVSTLSEDHAVPIDPYAADRVEVIRGPETLRYGGQALGGVVSIDNNRVPSRIPGGGFTGEITGGLSSVDDGKNGAFNFTGGARNLAVHADGFARRSEDYRTPLGIEANSYSESVGGSAGFSVVSTKGFVGVALGRVESDYGIPDETSHIELQQDKIISKGEWRLGAHPLGTVRYWFGGSDYAHNEISDDGDIGSRFTNREQEFRAEFEQQPFASSVGMLSGIWGGQWGHGKLRGQSFEGDSLLEPAETERVGAFVFQNLALTENLKIMGAGRIEHAQITGSGIVDFSDPFNIVTVTGDRDFTPVSFSGGVAYELGFGLAGRLTGQYVERAPEAAELFSKGLHEATGTFEIGNPNLRKERARSVELGLKKANGALRFDASAYYTSFDGFIAKVLTGVGCGDTLDTCGVEDKLDQLLFEQRDARFYGAEVAFQYDAAPVWKGVLGVDGQYDFVHAQFSDGENVPRMPPHRLGGGIYYRDANWLMRAGLLHAFDQDRIASLETPTDGYTLVTVEAGYTSAMTGHGNTPTQYTIGVKGENLADEIVRNHSSFKKEEVLQPGASVRVYGSIKLN